MATLNLHYKTGYATRLEKMQVEMLVRTIEEQIPTSSTDCWFQSQLVQSNIRQKGENLHLFWSTFKQIMLKHLLAYPPAFVRIHSQNKSR